MIDREHWEKMLPIIQAFVNGQTVQHKSGEGDEWIDIEEESYFVGCPVFYRIKPESKYRPFKSQEECWNEMLKHQPWGWLKSKKNGRFICIGEMSWSDEFETVYIALSTSESLSRSADSVFEEYTFADGAPFGVMEE